jgi:hypothetical protein
MWMRRFVVPGTMTIAGILVVLLLATAAPLFAGFAGTDVFLPAVGRRPGDAGSQWYTLLWIHNPSATTANVSIFFLERNAPNPSPLVFLDSIPPGDTHRYPNTVGTLFGVEKWGALRITANVAVLASCRMYNLPPGGEDSDTQGQVYNTIPASFAIANGQSARVLGVNQTTPRNAGQFRYSFGWVETSGATADVRVIAYDENGDVIGDKVYPTTGGYEPRYYPIEDLVPAINHQNVTLEVRVVGGAGRIIAVGSGVANHSNDATTFEMGFRDELLSSGSTGLSSVVHDNTLVGDGTSSSPLGIANGGVTKGKLSAPGGGSGQVLATDGTNLMWQSPAQGGFALPFSGSTSANLTALRVEHTSPTDNSVAIYGQANSTSGVGIWGSTIATSGTTFAVSGYATSSNGVGVAGTAASLYGQPVGVFASASSSGGTGLLGYCDAKTGQSLGVAGGVDSPDGTGIFGAAYSTYGTNVGVYGYTKSATGYAGYFEGAVRVTGYLYKSGGGFQIDDPLDPANKYLNHSFVESPDMKNVYDGVVVLDEEGAATVQLPEWFGALNRDFRYQLTCVGGFAPVFIAKEISGNFFTIAGGKPGLKVSWQVTGIRKDPWANSHRIPVEQDKPDKDKGQYLYPPGFGQPESKAIGQRSAENIPRRSQELMRHLAQTK